MKKIIKKLIPLATGIAVGVAVGRVNKKNKKNTVDIRILDIPEYKRDIQLIKDLIF